MGKTLPVALRVTAIGMMALLSTGASGACDDEGLTECGGCECIRVEERVVNLTVQFSGQDDDETPLCSDSTQVVDLSQLSDWQQQTARAVRVRLTGATATIHRISEANTAAEVNGRLLLGPSSEASATTLVGTVDHLTVREAQSLELQRDGEAGAADEITKLLNDGDQVNSKLRADWHGCVDRVPAHFDVDIQLTLLVGITVPNPWYFSSAF